MALEMKLQAELHRSRTAVRSNLSEIRALQECAGVTHAGVIERVVPESGVKIAILDLDRFQLLNLSQDVIREIL